MSCLVFTICSTIVDKFGRGKWFSSISKYLAEPFFFKVRGEIFRGLDILNFYDKSIIFDFVFHLRCYWARQLLWQPPGENAPLERDHSVCVIDAAATRVTHQSMTAS